MVFYTGLYRALTFPRRLDEPKIGGGAGETRHWSPYASGNGSPYFDGPLVTDNGFWDTFRTVYPLLSLLYPDHLQWIIKGWVKVPACLTRITIWSSLSKVLFESASRRRDRRDE